MMHEYNVFKEEQPLPGLVDLQVNGFAGVDFNAERLEEPDVRSACARLRAECVVAFLPTLVSNRPELIEKNIETLCRVAEHPGENEAKIFGIHLEGPFISPLPGARGAHPVKWIRPPDVDWIKILSDLSGNRLKIVTLSPEWPDSTKFIEFLIDRGIRVAIGHTSASPEQIGDAVRAGASLSTHLGNGIPAMLPRHSNALWSQLPNDNLWASAIGDGFHLPEDVFTVVRRIKRGKLFLVSDATKFTGMPPGVYDTLIGGRVELDDEGRLSLAEDKRLLAGAALSLRAMIEKLTGAAWLSFEDAWEMGSVRPWSYLGETAPLETVIVPRSLR